MDIKNVKSLESLSFFCHMCGLISILLGIFVIFYDAIHGDLSHIQVGIFIFISGYTYVKISERTGRILLIEKKLDKEKQV